MSVILQTESLPVMAIMGVSIAIIMCIFILRFHLNREIGFPRTQLRKRN